MGDECFYTIKLWMRGFDDFRLLSVSEEDWRRARSILSDGDKGFIGLNTIEGASMFINCAHIIGAHFLWDPAVFQRPQREECERLSAFMAGVAEPITAADVELDDLQTLSLELDTYDGDEPRFVLFPDEDGEEIALNVSDLVLLEYPSEWEREPGEEANDNEGEDASSV